MRCSSTKQLNTLIDRPEWEGMSYGDGEMVRFVSVCVCVVCQTNKLWPNSPNHQFFTESKALFLLANKTERKEEKRREKSKR